MEYHEQEDTKPPPVMDSTARCLSSIGLLLRRTEKLLDGFHTPWYIRNPRCCRRNFDMHIVRA